MIERLYTDDRGGIVHNTLCALSGSLYDVVYTDFEWFSQCASKLSEISLTHCDDTFLPMLSLT